MLDSPSKLKYHPSPLYLYLLVLYVLLLVFFCFLETESYSTASTSDCLFKPHNVVQAGFELVVGSYHATAPSYWNYRHTFTPGLFF